MSAIQLTTLHYSVSCANLLEYLHKQIGLNSFFTVALLLPVLLLVMR